MVKGKVMNQRSRIIDREAEEKELEERKASKRMNREMIKWIEKEAMIEDVEDVGKDEPKEMITREQRAILLKQGYGVVGSHRYWWEFHLRIVL